MNTLKFGVKSNFGRPKVFSVFFDFDRFESLASNLGFFNPGFIDSVEQAEADYKSGKYRKIKSLKSLASK